MKEHKFNWYSSNSAAEDEVNQLTLQGWEVRNVWEFAFESQVGFNVWYERNIEPTEPITKRELIKAESTPRLKELVYKEGQIKIPAVAVATNMALALAQLHSTRPYINYSDTFKAYFELAITNEREIRFWMFNHMNWNDVASYAIYSIMSNEVNPDTIFTDTDNWKAVWR